MYKKLRLISLICFFALTSNLVGNVVWTYMENKQVINLTVEEDETDTDENKNRGSKRAANLLEEELHLAEHTSSISNTFSDPNSNRQASFSIISDKPKGSEKAPLENPPEIGFEFS